jgi:hypothetical protein
MGMDFTVAIDGKARDVKNRMCSMSKIEIV